MRGSSCCVLRRCTSQFFFGDRQPRLVPLFRHPPRQPDLGMFLLSGGCGLHDSALVFTRNCVPSSGSRRIGPPQCGQLEARSTLGQLGRQHENDHGTSPGSCSDHDSIQAISPVPPVSKTLVSSLPRPRFGSCAGGARGAALARHQRSTPQSSTGTSPVPGWTPRFNPVRELASGSGLQN